MQRLIRMLYITLSLLFYLSIQPYFSPNFSEAYLSLDRFLQFLHSHCLKLFQSPSPLASDLRQALICGKKIYHNKELLFILKHCGIIHLFVISGLHLNTLESINRKLVPKPMVSIINYFTFALLTFVTQLSIPCTRTFIQKMVNDLNRYFKWRFSKNSILLTTTLVTLVVLPKSLMSFSLLLSATASLIITSSFTKSQWRLSLALYLGLAPLLLKFALPHPASIITNAILTPVLAPLLIPSSLLLPTPLYEDLWSFLFSTLSPIANSFAFHLKYNIPKPWAWVYLIALHGTLQIFETYKKRRLLKKYFNAPF